MNNDKLQKLIDQFDYEHLTSFFREKNSTFKPIRESLDHYDDSDFSNGKKIGEIPYNLFESLIVCAFKVNKQLSERSGKKTQYEKVKAILKDTKSDAGIFVFYDEQGNFRFSLVYANYAGHRRDWSAFRRFTYFVSPQLTNRTFKQRIGEGDFSTLESLKEAFSVEKVTSRFFDEFRKRFDQTKREFEEANKHSVCLWLKSKYDTADYEEQVNKFIFTFLGRIIFLYFLLRKGWIEGNQGYIRKIFEDDTQTNLYLDVLVPLFFDVFAKQEPDRPDHIREQYKSTPYLNGGLFERSDLELEMAKEGKFVLFRDEFLRDVILNFFEIYNFTVDENSPNDQEVSIDPEMLGKVFENTLAEEERNKKGTFYTPREVVHFMVKDAIRQYIHNETTISLELLQRLLYNEEEPLDYLTPEQIRHIDVKLEGIKVLDPAVGSGAFPVEFMQVLIDLRKRLNVQVGRNINEVALKKQLIKNNLYGVDIDPGAIEIAKLRLWLSLIVDYEISLAEPLPNLDFQFRVGNSLQEKIEDIDIFNENNYGQSDWLRNDLVFNNLKQRMIQIKNDFYSTTVEKRKHILKEEFDALEHQLIQAVLDRYSNQIREQLNNRQFEKTAKQVEITAKKIQLLQQKIKDGTYKLFKPDFHFSEVFDRKDAKGQRAGGFDIVIGNPPYGVSIEDDIKEWHGLGSKDSYGVFISTALKRFLKPGGVLEFIVSDTWLTIKTHKPLRQQVLEKSLHKIIRMHQDCFEATVNACILNVSNKESNKNTLIAADLTNISTRNKIEKLHDTLYHLEKHIGVSTPVYAVYAYDQNLIHTNSNIPIFVGSPKFFALMQDVGVKTIKKEIGGKIVPVRQVNFNGKLIELVRFGDIADVKVGLQTGDNKSYLYQNPKARGSYRDITPDKKYLLTENDLREITANDKRRLKVIDKGIHKSRSEEGFDEDRWFEGRYIVPYDKGGESDTETGWMPNYYVPINYFIDWSTWAIERMKTLTIGGRDGKENKQLAAVFRNVDQYFLEGITFSDSGIYSPTFRINFHSVFDQKGSCIFSKIDHYRLLGILASKLIKSIVRMYINHSISSHVDCLKEIPYCYENNVELLGLVERIIAKQKQNPKYEYAKNEQVDIDKIIYSLYGFLEDDIFEVETWHARRYPKLAHLC